MPAGRGDRASCLLEVQRVTGAIVGSLQRDFLRHRLRLSIPFTSGPSLVLFAMVLRDRPPADFQSPSRRGHRWFTAVGADQCDLVSSFNPLHVGAIVGSPAKVSRLSSSIFQSPSRRGHRWFSRPLGAAQGRPGTFQSPSRRGHRWFGSQADSSSGAFDFQSPSRRGHRSFADVLGSVRQSLSFNPLHVGAIVGSVGWPAKRQTRILSIPFTSGPSLVRQSVIFSVASASFNPLHVGAIVGSGSPEAQTVQGHFQSPSRRGHRWFL